MATEGQAIIEAPKTGPVIPGISGPIVHQLKTLFGLAAALSLGVAIIFWAIEPSYTPVFNKLSDRDVGQVAEVLKQENIPYRIEEGTGLVLVPHDQLQSARMKLTASGMPYGGSGGFESLREEQRLGTSQFMETARYHHVLETELGRTIVAMRNVESVRVHLALPKQSVFVRKRAKSSASVMVKLFPGRSLAQDQVTSIVHLVASSVPYMTAADVTVIDQWGRMLTSKDDGMDISATRSYLEYTRKLELDYSERIEALLTPIVGFGRVKAEVNADLDFSSDESVQELYSPDSSSVRSEQTQESESDNGFGAVGVPGALTNQPPAGGSLGVVDAPGEPGLEGAENNKSGNTNRSVVRNYEIDKTIRRTKQSQGGIRRLTIAVIVDDKFSISAGQEEPVRTAYSQEELDRFAELVKKAVGFNEDRGDSIEVINSAFQPVDTVEPLPEPAIWEQAWVWSLVKQVLSAAVVLFMIFGIVRPAMRSMGAKAEAQGNAKVADKTTAPDSGSEQDEDRLTLTDQSNKSELPAPPQVYGDILNMARAMASQDPKRVAKVIKDWVAEDGG